MLTLPPASMNLGVPETSPSIPALTEAVNSQSYNIKTASQPPQTGTGSPSYLSSPYTPTDMVPVGFSISELLGLEGLKLNDVAVMQVDGQVAKVVKKGSQWFTIHQEVVGGMDTFRLIEPEPAVSTAIMQQGLDVPVQGITDRATDAILSRPKEDIVDRPGDPEYKNWVARVLKPKVQGSERVKAEGPPPDPNEEYDGGFWWMDAVWRGAYRKEKNLGQVVQHQIEASLPVVVFGDV